MAQDRCSWVSFSPALTICCTQRILTAVGVPPHAQQAWREKVALCLLFASVAIMLGYFTIGLQQSICPDLGKLTNFNPGSDFLVIAGSAYSRVTLNTLLPALGADWNNVDLSSSFSHPQCKTIFNETLCQTENKMRQIYPPGLNCLSIDLISTAQSMPVLITWPEIELLGYIVYNGAALSIKFDTLSIPLDLLQILQSRIGSDATLLVLKSSVNIKIVDCLAAKFAVAHLGSQSTGCTFYSGLQIIVLVVVVSLILVRFIMAIIFHWFIAPSLSKQHQPAAMNIFSSGKFVEGGYGRLNVNTSMSFSKTEESNIPYTICLVTCYSESLNSLKSTLDSLAATDYPTSRKLLFVICDGLVVGEGNTKSTPDLVCSLVRGGEGFDVSEKSYLAIADGKKQHNMARVVTSTLITVCRIL